MTCAIETAQTFNIALIREGRNSYRATCPRCHDKTLTFAPAKNGDGFRFFSTCHCYDQNGFHSGSGENLSFWLRNMGYGGTYNAPQPIAVEDTAELDLGKLRRIYEVTRHAMPGSIAEEYLLNRGLSVDTQRGWGLGFGYFHAAQTRCNTVTIPWFDHDRHFVGMSHRLIQPIGKIRAPWHPGMSGHTNGLMAGWHTHSPDNDTLIICEGVLNGPSVYQAMRGAVNVLTPGSENVEPAQWPLDAIRRHKTVICWADKPEIAQKWATTIGNCATAIYSRTTEADIKLDANELLQRGMLRAHLLLRQKLGPNLQ